MGVGMKNATRSTANKRLFARERTTYERRGGARGGIRRLRPRLYIVESTKKRGTSGRDKKHRPLYDKLESLFRSVVQQSLIDETFGLRFASDRAVLEDYP